MTLQITQSLLRRAGVLTKSSKANKVQTAPISLVAKDEVHRFIEDVMKSVGTPPKHATILANVLCEADYRGHYSHGLGRLDVYFSDVSHGTCDAAVTPKVLKESASTAWMDGQKGLGPVVGEECMKLAIKKAADSGIGFVVAKGSNHFGIASWYSMMALKDGMVGMSFTNTSPIMSPTRSKEAALGTNPLSLAAPSGENDSVILDMATTAAALGKIEVNQRMGTAIPAGWAQGPDGKPTTDADLAYKTSCLQPLGGTEATAGYKGYGLSLMIEVLTGVLGGAAYGPTIRRWGRSQEVADLGQSFLAVNPDFFAPGFRERMADLSGKLRSMEPAERDKPVLVPGDPERIEMSKVDKEGGLRYPASYIQKLESFAESIKVKPMKVIWTKEKDRH